MSKPSNILQRPSPNILILRQKGKKVMFPHDDEHLTRQLSNISNEGYHGGESASVPFVWESQPGTPKVRFRENSLPPLTPPPSYYQNATKKPTFNSKKNSSPKASLLKAIFPKLATRNKGCVPPPPPPESPNSLSYSSSSSSSSSSLLPTSYCVPSSPMIHSGKSTQDEDMYGVPGSSLCFGNARSRGRYSFMFKKVLMGDSM